MKAKFLRLNNIILIGAVSLLGLTACKKEPTEPSKFPDYGQIVPCYGVIVKDFCKKVWEGDNLHDAPINVDNTPNNED